MNKEQRKRLAELRALEAKGDLTGEQTAELTKLLELEKESLPEIKAGEKTTRQFDCEVKSINEESYTLEAIASTPSVDRYGDIVDQASWDLKKFKKNPVILANHFYTVQNIIGRATNIKVVDGKLVMKVKFAVQESELALAVWKLIIGGYLNAWSVGFIPKNFEEEKDKAGNYQRILKDCELLEVSAVAVPANADCLTNALDDGKLNSHELKTLKKALPEEKTGLTDEEKLIAYEENRELLKKYRGQLKHLRTLLRLNATGDEVADLKKTVEMAEFCLALDETEEDPDNTNDTTPPKVDNEPPETPAEAKKAKPATQDDINAILARIR